MGEYLRDMEKNKGAAMKRPTTEGGRSEPTTYEEIGITYKEASEAQTLSWRRDTSRMALGSMKSAFTGIY
jgi:hypothetical protein